jgi:cell division protein FtsW
MMGNGFTAEKLRRDSGDVIFLGLVLLLLGVGTAVLFSSSYYYGELKFDDPVHFIRRQSFLVALGLGLSFLASRISLETIKKFVPFMILVSLILSLLTFVPGIGNEVMGARRWIYLFGWSFQPSELVKVALVVYLAYIFSKKGERLDDFTRSVFPPLVISGLFIVLVYLQNDFSTAFFLFFLCLVMFFIARIKLVYFIFLASIGLPLAAILLFTKEHRVRRIMAFLNPQSDPIGASYQVNAARDALTRGGLWGQGLGEGTKKLGGLPEAHSDFVFAVLGEEMGFLGVFFVIAVFIVFAARGYLVAVKSKDRFGYYLCFGLMTSILYQALLNLSVVSGLVPATGIPLPFFSSGGSSIIMTLVMCGLVYNVSRRAERETEEVAAYG